MDRQDSEFFVSRQSHLYRYNDHYSSEGEMQGNISKDQDQVKVKYKETSQKIMSAKKFTQKIS